MNTAAINAATSTISRILSNSPMVRSAMGELLVSIDVESITVEVAEEKNVSAGVSALGSCIAYLAEGNNHRAVSEIKSAMYYLQIASI